MKKTKFDLLFESIMDSCKDTKTEITETAAKGLPRAVKNAIAKFIYDYLTEEKDIIDWPEAGWETYSELMRTGKMWEKDEELQEHYSCPSDHYWAFEQLASYDPKTKTVTMSEVGNIDDIWLLADEDEDELQEIIKELNEKWNTINGITFVWE